MAQNILLRRSNIQGKTPTTASMSVGEIALNTFDGKAFMYVSSSTTQSIQQVVVTGAQITGSINLFGNQSITGSLTIASSSLTLNNGSNLIIQSGGFLNVIGSGSFGELSVSNDINVTGSIYVAKDIVVLMDIDVVGNITGSTISASFFKGDGSQLTNVVVSPSNNYDFNVTPSAGFVGYMADSGSNYYVTPYSNSVKITTGSVTVASFSSSSIQLLGIGDVVSFSSSIASQIAALQYSSSMVDAGVF